MLGHQNDQKNGNPKLGEFLRSRRTRLSPADVGIPTKRRRRTPGLLREEVAELAGISAEWYVKLEQGRSTSPSQDTLDGLARALRLDGKERRHLAALASSRPQPEFVQEVVPTGLRTLVERLQQPAYLTGRRLDVLVWNTAAAELLTDFSKLKGEDRNILAWMLLMPSAKDVFGETWDAEAQRIIALFRANSDVWGDDDRFRVLVERCRSGCVNFEQWWARHDVDAPRSGVKLLKPYGRKATKYRYSSFQANDDLSIKLTLYVELN